MEDPIAYPKNKEDKIKLAKKYNAPDLNELKKNKLWQELTKNPTPPELMWGEGYQIEHFCD